MLENVQYCMTYNWVREWPLDRPGRGRVEVEREDSNEQSAVGALERGGSLIGPGTDPPTSDTCITQRLQHLRLRCVARQTADMCFTTSINQTCDYKTLQGGDLILFNQNSV